MASQSNYWNSQSKLIFISTRSDRQPFVEIIKFLHFKGILNSILIGNSDGKNLDILSFNPFESDVKKQCYVVSFKNSTTINDFFPDKLTDMKKYQYKIIFEDEIPTIFTIKRKSKISFFGYRKTFMDLVTHYRNATAKYHYITRRKNANTLKTFDNALKNRIVDLSLNGGYFSRGYQRSYIKYVNTFEIDGFCAILPYPERKSFFAYIVKPFDLWTWILILMSAACFAAVWHLLNKYSSISNPNTAWYFLFAFVTFFTGQGVEFREHRLMQKTLIQLMVLMTFIFGNLYQSVLISLMAEPRYGDQIKSIQEMIDSNFTFKVGPSFLIIFNRSEQYQKLSSKITSTFDEGEIDCEEFKYFAAEKI
jgi:hypothetical protein